MPVDQGSANPRRLVWRVLATFGTSLLILVLLLPFAWTINGSETCYALAGYPVPCSLSPSLAAALTGGVAVWIALGRRYGDGRPVPARDRIWVPAVGGLVVLILLYPTGGGGLRCDAVLFDYDVPCNPMFSILAAVVAAGIIWLAYRVRPRGVASLDGDVDPGG